MSAQDRIERLCEVMADENFDQYLQRADAADVVARIVATIRDGGTPDSVVDDLDLLDEAFAAKVHLDGLTLGERSGGTGEAGSRYSTGTGVVTAPRPKLPMWACPAATRCSRLEPVRAPEPDPTPPLCTVTGNPMQPFDTRS